ncbi:hypothetical protein ACOSQ3_025216 [Xanthoceras sorbifolium]
MKCCFLRRKDLDHYYKKMFGRYYMLNGYNDESLRQVYINSLPEELQSELQRQITSTRKNLSDITMGEIHYMALKLFSKMLQNKKKFEKSVKLSYNKASLNPLLLHGLARPFMLKNDLKRVEEKIVLLLIINP